MNGPAQEPLDLTIILPTRNEAANVAPLVEAIGAALAGGQWRYELLFVDDSSDETPAEIQRQAAGRPEPIRLIHRPVAERDGLSGAVVAGLRAAAGHWTLVMDADLQHPPATIPQLLQRAAATAADVVIASRQSGVTGPIGLSAQRALTSQGLTILARALFPNLLRNASDPLTGFFLVRRASIDLGSLRPDGFKILLEILIRCPTLRVTEIHFPFGQRHGGESKADFREGLRFFRHLLRLRLSANPSINQVILIVIAGFLLDILLFWAAVRRGSAPVLAAILSAHGAMALHVSLAGWRGVFDLPGGRGVTWPALRSFLWRNEALLLLRLPLLWWWTGPLAWPPLPAHVVALLLGAGLRYLLSDRWVWTQHSIPASPVFHHYNIHDILHLESTVQLPALAYFYDPARAERVDIRLQIDRYGTPRCAAGSICYDEGLGRLGFGVAINPGDTTEVTASALLEKSPDVLYTSIVEPLLRWAFVRRGYALVYGACIARAGRALFIHDPHGIGKTNLVLEAGLAAEGWHFLSDDMTILSADGQVLCYPKPIIVKQPILWALADRGPAGPAGRLRLFLQRTLYSPLTHWGGLLLYRLRLPAATINAIVQRLIPPRRQPLATLSAMPLQRAARLEQIVRLDAGPEQRQALNPAATRAMLAQSVEHAFVFPPYPELARALRLWRGEDLGEREAAIIAGAIGNRGAWQLATPSQPHWPWLARGVPYPTGTGPVG